MGIFCSFISSALELVSRRINRARLRRHVSPFLIAAGAILTLYVANTYYAAYRAQRRLMRQWQQQSTSEPSRTQEPGLNRISIPKIGLDAVIVEGTYYFFSGSGAWASSNRGVAR